jgi:hypothetical protein
LTLIIHHGLRIPLDILRKTSANVEAAWRRVSAEYSSMGAALTMGPGVARLAFARWPLRRRLRHWSTLERRMSPRVSRE